MKLVTVYKLENVQWFISLLTCKIFVVLSLRPWKEPARENKIRTICNWKLHKF